MDVRQHANIKESQPKQMKLWSLLLAKSHHQPNNTMTSSISDSPSRCFSSFCSSGIRV